MKDLNHLYATATSTNNEVDEKPDVNHCEMTSQLFWQQLYNKESLLE